MRPLILLSLGLQVAQVAPAPRLTYLANMGVLIERGDHRVVIDALHRGALADYASLPPSLRTSLEAATGEWRDLDLALTTHRHLDHFDAGAVAARLAVDSSIVYLAARETVDTLVARSTVSARDPRVRAVVPPERGRHPTHSRRHRRPGPRPTPQSNPIDRGGERRFHRRPRRFHRSPRWRR